MPAGKYANIIKSAIGKNFTAGYTDTGSAIFIVKADDTDIVGQQVALDHGGDSIVVGSAGVKKVSERIDYQELFQGDIIIKNFTGTELTDGDPANTLTISIYYVLTP